MRLHLVTSTSIGSLMAALVAGSSGALAACGTGGTISTTTTNCQTIAGGGSLTVTSTGSVNVTSNNDSVTVPSQTSGVTITNNGTISNAYASGKRAILINGATQSNLVIDNSGTITASGDDAIHGGSSGTKISAGSISITNELGGIIRSTGTTSSTNGQAIDLDNTSGAIQTTITNYGTISGADSDAMRPGENATVNNYGTIIGNSVNGDTGNDGIDFQSHTSASTVSNYQGGTITGARHGITGNGSINIDNAGTITGNLGSGINLDTTSGTTFITNRATGVINGTAGGSSDGDGIDVDYLVNIKNYGHINAYGTWNGGLSEAVTVGGGTISNYAGGVIYSVQRAITVDDSNDGNAYAPTTIYNEGTIQGDNGEAISITSAFANTITNKGTIIGSIKTGSGDDTFNLYTGSSISGLIDGGGGSNTINLYGSGTGTLANVANIGTLNVDGGAWTITDMQTYANGIGIASGASLYVDGTLGGLTTIASGGLLGGTGTVGDTMVSAGATLAPGPSNATGTLAVKGDLTFVAGSTYAVSVTPTTASRTDVTGTSSLSGTVAVAAGAGDYLPSTRYTILTAGTIAGSFNGVTSNTAFLDPTLTQDAGDVYLTLTRNNVSFGEVATTPNQRAVADALTQASRTTQPNAGTSLLDAVYQLSASQARAAFDAIGGAGRAAAQTANQQAAEAATGALTDAAHAWLDGADVAPGVSQSIGAVLSSTPAPGHVKGPIVVRKASDLPQSRGWRAWGTFFGGGAKAWADGAGLSAANTNLVGGMFGLDYQMQPNWLVGAAVGGSQSHFSTDTATSGHADGLHVGLYSVYAMGPSYLQFSETFSALRDHSTRGVAGFGGLAGEVLTGAYDASEWRSRVELGRRFDLGALRVTPFAAVELATLDSNPYIEKSNLQSSVFALSTARDHATSLPAFLGVRFTGQLAMFGAWKLTPSATLAWVHEFEGRHDLTSTLVSLPDASFTLAGLGNARDGLQTKLGAELANASGFAFFGEFNGVLSGNGRSYAGKGGLRYTW